MLASLTIGGIEVALTTPRGVLETAVAERYAPFLGAVEAPVCSILLEANRRDEELADPGSTLVERTGQTKFRVTHPALFGLFDIGGTGVLDVPPTRYGLDHGLRLLFGLLAPYHDAVMLHATSVIGDDGAHVFMGSSQATVVAHFSEARAVLTDGLVMVRREHASWVAASTPFWASYQDPGPGREDKLGRLWALEDAASPAGPASDAVGRSIAAHTLHPTSDPEWCRLVTGIAEQVARDVPVSVLLLASLPAWGAVVPPLRRPHGTDCSERTKL